MEVGSEFEGGSIDGYLSLGLKFGADIFLSEVVAIVFVGGGIEGYLVPVAHCYVAAAGPLSQFYWLVGDMLGFR